MIYKELPLSGFDIQKNPSRLFICDPVCVFPYGHNIAAMNNFRNLLGEYYEKVVCLGCRELSESVASLNAIERVFSYYYNDAMPLQKEGLNQRSDLPRSHDQKIEVAKQDLVQFMKRWNINSTDTICYPSIDFYSLLALNESIDELRAAGSPKLLIRLIGVMETASSVHYGKPLDVVLALLTRLLASGIRVRIAAETPRYAGYLAMQLNCLVEVAANIEVREQIDLPDAEHFNVICPGSARYDKGFLNLVEIFTAVRLQDPEMRIRFFTQVLPDRDLKYQIDYLARLYAIPGTTIFPSILSAKDLEAMYHKGHIVLLPYASDVYECRGSAVLIEAILFGRQCVALDGPAFIDQMCYFSAGTACSSISEMANEILALSKKSQTQLHAKAAQARSRFVRDLAMSYRSWAA